MDPIQILLYALVSGAAAGLQPTAEQAVKDGYNALKILLGEKYGLLQDLERLEIDPHSRGVRAKLEIRIKRMDIYHDREVLRMAESFIDRVGRSGEDFDILDSDRLIELARAQAGAEAMEKILDDYVGQVMVVRDLFPLENLQLVSSNMQSNQSLPLEIRTKVKGLRSELRFLIENVAESIERDKYGNLEGSLENMRLPAVERQRARAIVTADRQVHVSCQSLKLTVDYFTQLNKTIMARLEAAVRSSDSRLESSLVLGNALLVYELTDFVIDYIERFKMLGLTEVEGLDRQTREKLELLRKDEQQLAHQASQSGISPDLRTQILTHVEDRRQAIEMLQQEWNEYVTSVKSLDESTASVSSQLPDLRLIRDNARAQISLLEVVAMLSVLRSNLGAIQSTMFTLSSIELAPLSPDRVRRLLGIPAQSRLSS